MVHFAAERTLRLLAADTHYRNQFETSTSGGHLSTNARSARAARARAHGLRARK